MLHRVFRALAVVAFVAASSSLVVSDADARVGSSISSGSRGSRTFSAPSSTSTMPSTSTMQRTTTQPDSNAARPSYMPGGGFFGRPPGFFGAGGFLRGIAGGFIGAGLFGLLFGHGILGGIGGFGSFLGLIVQLGLIALIAMWVRRLWMRGSQPAYAAGPLYRNPANPLGNISALGGGGSGPAQRSDDIGIGTADYDAFERLLGDIQTAYSNEDLSALRRCATPEMVSYFSEDLAQNASRGVRNRVDNVRLLQGDLAEAWREGGTEYATVAMRFSLNDTMIERASGRIIEGGPQEATEAWTFRRTRGGAWMLSAIQQRR